MRRELRQQRVARLALDPELGEQLAVEVGVAEPDHGAVEPGGVERRLEHLDHLGRALRRGRPDQLDPGLGELAHLAALRAHRPVGVGDVAEAERRLGVGEAAGDQAGDRDRHVGAQRQQLAALVEEAVGAGGGAAVAARQHLVVLDRRRRDLAVAVALEDLDQARWSRRSSRISSGSMSRVPGGIGWIIRRPYESRTEEPCYGGDLWRRPARCGRRGRAGARRSARSRGRSGGCCRSPRCRRRPARR